MMDDSGCDGSRGNDSRSRRGLEELFGQCY